METTNIKKEIKRWIDNDHKSDITHKVFNSGIGQLGHRLCMGEKEPYKHMTKTELGELKCFAKLMERKTGRKFKISI